MGASAGDFEAYAERRSPALLRLAWLLTGDMADAEDLVQTALSRVFQHWGKVSTAENVDAYVRRVLLNASRSRLRRRRPRTVPLGAADGAGGRETSMSRVDDRFGLAPALRSLPVRQRQVVVLRYIEDLAERDVARLLGCSVGTVKSSASRGLAALRAHPGVRLDDDTPVAGSAGQHPRPGGRPR